MTLPETRHPESRPWRDEGSRYPRALVMANGKRDPSHGIPGNGSLAGAQDDELAGAVTHGEATW